MPQPQPGKLTGLQKAAILLIALGSDLSAKVLKQNFYDEDIERLTYTISNMDRVRPEIRDTVLDEFNELRMARQYLIQGGLKYARELLEKTVGPRKAEEIIKRLMSAAKILPFASLRRTDPRHLMNFIRDEHPQTIALVLAYLEPEQASMILSSLPPELQRDVAKRIATMDRTTPEVVQEVERVLERKLSAILQEDQTQVGGVNTLVNILNMATRSTEKAILEGLEAEDPMLAEEVRKRMFVFEDIVKLDDLSIQRVLREVQSKDLALAMRGANEEVRERIFRNMSKRASDMLRDELQYMGPVRLRDVEEAQQRIVKIIRNLEESGEIVISRGGEDAVLI
jgi:flagellar motor switch protein FliG